MCPADPVRNQPEPPNIGRYEVHQEIGRGSSGIVYLARDPLIGRWVALKTLGERFSRRREDVEALRRRLVHEAQSAGALSHPAIVAVFDVVEHGEGRLSIACEYVEGSDLRRRLAEPEPLPLEFAGRVVREVAAALDHAHARGVVHRDLKPGNILLGADGTIKVTDFGIAGLRERDLADDLKDLGSPNYLAPERILGQPGEAAGDVYALGVVLYEMLTRNPPFSGDTVAELARNIVERKAAPIDHYRPDIFPEMIALLDRALAKEPAARYPSAGELAASLDRVLERQASHSDTVPTPVFEELALAPPETPPTPPAAPAAPAPPAQQVEPVEAVRAAAPPALPAPAAPPAAKAVAAAAPAAPAARGAPSPPRPADRTPPARRRPSRRPLLYLVPVALGLAIAAAAFFGGRLDDLRNPAAAPAAVGADAAGEKQLEYLRLLAESRRLFAAGDSEAAQRLLDRAEEMSPAAARIRRLREAARAQARAEREALAEAERLDLLDEARADLEAGRLRSAAARVQRALEVAPEDEATQRLRDYIARRRAQQLARERSRQTAAPAPAAAQTPADEGFLPFTPPAVASAPPPALDGTGDLRIDFYSQRPRGVVTVYADSQQILNHAFRFFEKKSMLRRRGIAGGFDERAEVAAGALELRIYLSLPEEETQLQTVTGILPDGSLRTLRIRVDEAGALTTELH